MIGRAFRERRDTHSLKLTYKSWQALCVRFLDRGSLPLCVIWRSFILDWVNLGLLRRGGGGVCGRYPLCGTGTRIYLGIEQTT